MAYASDFYFLTHSLDAHSAEAPAQPAIHFNGKIEVNGVYLSAEVARQLRQGVNKPLEWLTRGELEAANLSFFADGCVIDDPDDTTCLGQMQLTGQEKRQRAAAPGIMDYFVAALMESEKNWSLDECVPWPEEGPELSATNQWLVLQA